MLFSLLQVCLLWCGVVWCDIVSFEIVLLCGAGRWCCGVMRCSNAFDLRLTGFAESVISSE